MKKIWVVFVVIFLVIFLDFITENYTNKVVSEVNRELKDINNKIEKGYVDNEFILGENAENDIRKMSKKVLDKWRKQDNILSFYIEHDEIEKVSDKINLLNKQIDIENFTDAISSINEAKFLLKHITEKQSLTWKNIF